MTHTFTGGFCAHAGTHSRTHTHTHTAGTFVREKKIKCADAVRKVKICKWTWCPRINSVIHSIAHIAAQVTNFECVCVCVSSCKHTSLPVSLAICLCWFEYLKLWMRVCMEAIYECLWDRDCVGQNCSELKAPLAPTPCSYHILENVSVYIQHWWQLMKCEGLGFHRGHFQPLPPVTLFWGERGHCKTRGGG